MTKTITIEKEVYEAVLMNSVKVADLEAENMQLRQFCEEFYALNVAEENQRLKELLRECNLLLIKQQANDEVEHKESVELVLRIDEALK